MIFMEHGIFEVKIEGDLLLVDATGPFNEELIIQYEKALETCIHSLEASEWKQVITLHRMSLCTPEAEQVLTDTVVNRKSRGLTACAVVLMNVEGESLIKTQMSRCYDRARVKHNFTTSVHDANEWLATL